MSYVYQALMERLFTGSGLPQMWVGLICRQRVTLIKRAFHGRLEFRRSKTRTREVHRRDWTDYERQPYDALTGLDCVWLPTTLARSALTIIGVVGWDAQSRGHKLVRFDVPWHGRIQHGDSIGVHAGPITLRMS